MSEPRFERVHIFGERWLPQLSSETLARFDDRELVVLPDQAAFIAALPTIDVVAGFGMDGAHWHTAERLRLIQWFGAGVDQLLLVEGIADHVEIANAGGVHEPQLPEFVMAAMFTMAYRFPQLLKQQAAHVWRQTMPRPLEGRTICILGLGRIGTSIARRAAAMGMRVTGIRHSGAAVEGVDVVATPERRLEALRDADVLVSIVPLTTETRGLIGAEELAALAPGATLIDVGRGGIVDLDAVVAALDSGHLSAATVDVHIPEPLPADSPLWDVPNLIVTPHTPWMSEHYSDRLFTILADSIEAIEAGDLPPMRVDRARGW